MEKNIAAIIYNDLREVSAKILIELGMLPEPHKPKVRTTKWKHGSPKGILYHYTNGPSGLKSMRWGNDPTWGNTGSSWHVMIFDRIPSNEVGTLWVKYASAGLRRLFPVPTIITADFRWGTWHGNWTCNMTLGIENRNTGYSGWQKVDKQNGIEKLGKTPFVLYDKKWEPYTREQIISNINIGRLLRGMIGTLDPNWILTHQCVWATKLDTGPAFPIHQIRNEIFNDDDLSKREWLQLFEMAPDVNEDDDAHWKALGEDQFEKEKDFVVWSDPKPNVEPVASDVLVAGQLWRMGFNAGPELPDHDTLTNFVRWLQRSTGAYKEKNPEKVLKPDGLVGKLTKAFLDKRIKQLGLD